MRILVISGFTFALFISWNTTVNAVATVYTDKAAWERALNSRFLTEDFADSELNAGVSFISSESGHINPARECYQDVLTSRSQNEPMTTWAFTPLIVAYGGNWTLGGPGGNGNSLLVYIDEVYAGIIPNSYSGGFWGIVSDTSFTHVKLIGANGSNQQHYCLDDMVYSHVSLPPAIWFLQLL